VRIYCLIVIVFLSILLSPSGPSAHEAESVSAGTSETAVVDLIPAALHAYTSSEELTEDAAGGLSVTGSPWEQGASALPSVGRLGYADQSSTVGSDGYLPLLLSVLLPGAGEFYMGYKSRGAALMVVEVAAWSGYLYNRGKGLDSRQAYEDYADEHWTIRRWIDHHPLVYDLTGYTIEDLEEEGKNFSGTGEWPGYLPWVSKEEDKQHYYENIGKYDWFISGWTDFDPEEDDPWMLDTPLRDEYRAKRMKSNDQLDNANKFIYLSIGARVFSIVETLVLLRSNSAGETDTVSQNRFRVTTRPRGFEGAEIAMEYRYK